MIVPSDLGFKMLFHPACGDLRPELSGSGGSCAGICCRSLFHSTTPESSFSSAIAAGRSNQCQGCRVSPQCGELAGPYGVRCSPAPIRGAGSSSRTWNTPPAVSTRDPTHHRADEGVGEGRVREVDRDRVIQNAASAGGCKSPTVRAAVRVQPIGDLGVPLAEASRRNADPDAHREETFGGNYHLSGVAWHCMFLIRSGQDCHARPDLSIGLGAPPSGVMLPVCVVASASPPM